ncbi:hypothetical protein HK102_005609 [Quaeritorhiza haematococci]|nr:hypothetical protein HK102_005609 [Quaeritorhiza haematococci]
MDSDREDMEIENESASGAPSTSVATPNPNLPPTLSVTRLQQLLSSSNVELITQVLEQFSQTLKRILRGDVDYEVSDEADLLHAYLARSAESECNDLFQVWSFQQEHRIKGRLETLVLDTFSLLISTSKYSITCFSSAATSSAFPPAGPSANAAATITTLKTTIVAVIRNIMRSHMKPVYRNLSSGSLHVVQATLRLLIAMSSFSTSTTKELFDTFNFNLKVLPNFFRIRKKQGPSEPTNEHHDHKSDSQSDQNPGSSRKPKEDVRTLYIRFILSFLAHGDANSKKSALEMKDFVSGIFKGIGSDPYELVKEILNVIRSNVINDNALNRTAKVAFFHNNSILDQLVKLYSRTDGPSFTSASSSTTTTARLLHDFLIHICTVPGVALCFRDNGWYPFRVAASTGVLTAANVSADTGKEGTKGGKVYNKVLLRFISSLRPTEDPLQQELVLEVLKSCPELIKPYWSALNTISFEPRGSTKWLSNMAFATKIVQLPVPHLFRGTQPNFLITSSSSSSLPLLPPPMATLADNILPPPLTRSILNRALQNKSSTVKYVGAWFLDTVFDKMGQVLKVVDEIVDRLKQAEELSRERQRRLRGVRVGEGGQIDVDLKDGMQDSLTDVDVEENKAWSAEQRAEALLNDPSVTGDAASASASNLLFSWEQLRTQLIDEVWRRIPDVQIVITLLHHVYQHQQKQRGQAAPKEDSQAVTDAAKMDEDEEQESETDATLLHVASLRLLGHYQRYYSDQMLESRFDHGKLFVGGSSGDAKENAGNFGLSGWPTEVVIELLKVIERVPDFKWWNKPNPTQPTHLTTLLHFYITTEDPKLRALTKIVIANLLQQSFLFKHHPEEIPLLMETLEHAGCGEDDERVRSTVLGFVVDECFVPGVKNPYQVVDRVSKLVSEVNGTSDSMEDSDHKMEMKTNSEDEASCHGIDTLTNYALDLKRRAFRRKKRSPEGEHNQAVYAAVEDENDYGDGDDSLPPWLTSPATVCIVDSFVTFIERLKEASSDQSRAKTAVLSRFVALYLTVLLRRTQVFGDLIQRLASQIVSAMHSLDLGLLSEGAVQNGQRLEGARESLLNVLTEAQMLSASNTSFGKGDAEQGQAVTPKPKGKKGKKGTKVDVATDLSPESLISNAFASFDPQAIEGRPKRESNGSLLSSQALDVLFAKLIKSPSSVDYVSLTNLVMLHLRRLYALKREDEDIPIRKADNTRVGKQKHIIRSFKIAIRILRCILDVSVKTPVYEGVKDMVFRDPVVQDVFASESRMVECDVVNGTHHVRTCGDPLGQVFSAASEPTTQLQARAALFAFSQFRKFLSNQQVEEILSHVFTVMFPLILADQKSHISPTSPSGAKRALGGDEATKPGSAHKKRKVADGGVVVASTSGSSSASHNGTVVEFFESVLATVLTPVHTTMSVTVDSVGQRRLVYVCEDQKEQELLDSANDDVPTVDDHEGQDNISSEHLAISEFSIVAGKQPGLKQELRIPASYYSVLLSLIRKSSATESGSTTATAKPDLETTLLLEPLYESLVPMGQRSPSVDSFGGDREYLQQRSQLGFRVMAGDADSAGHASSTLFADIPMLIDRDLFDFLMTPSVVTAPAPSAAQKSVITITRAHILRLLIMYSSVHAAWFLENFSQKNSDFSEALKQCKGAAVVVMDALVHVLSTVDSGNKETSGLNVRWRSDVNVDHINAVRRALYQPATELLLSNLTANLTPTHQPQQSEGSSDLLDDARNIPLGLRVDEPALLIYLALLFPEERCRQRAVVDETVQSAFVSLSSKKKTLGSAISFEVERIKRLCGWVERYIPYLIQVCAEDTTAENENGGERGVEVLGTSWAKVVKLCLLCLRSYFAARKKLSNSAPASSEDFINGIIHWTIRIIATACPTTKVFDSEWIMSDVARDRPTLSVVFARSLFGKNENASGNSVLKTFVIAALKFRFTDRRICEFLRYLLGWIFEVESSDEYRDEEMSCGMTPASLTEMITSHSQFDSIMRGSPETTDDNSVTVDGNDLERPRSEHAAHIHQSKASMLRLLYHVISSDPVKCCTKTLLRKLASFYQGTRSPSDRTLLRIMSLYETNMNVSIAPYVIKGFNKAVTMARNDETTDMHLVDDDLVEDGDPDEYIAKMSIASINEALSLISSTWMTHTVHWFDVYQNIEDVLEQRSDKRANSDTNALRPYTSRFSPLYDISFLVPLITNAVVYGRGLPEGEAKVDNGSLNVKEHLVPGGPRLDIRRLLESNGFGLILATLSSADATVRKAGYFAVSLVYSMIQESNLKERNQLILLLDSFRNAINAPQTAEQSDAKGRVDGDDGELSDDDDMEASDAMRDSNLNVTESGDAEDEPKRIPAIMTLFIAQACMILRHPDSHMYPHINKFLLQRPVMDLTDVPMFYNMFYSTTDFGRRERIWMLRLLAYGLNTAMDYRLYKRRHVLDTLTSFFQSPLADAQIRKLILEIIFKATFIPSVLADMIVHGSLLTFFQACGSQLRLPSNSSFLNYLSTSAGDGDNANPAARAKSISAPTSSSVPGNDMFYPFVQLLDRMFGGWLATSPQWQGRPGSGVWLESFACVVMSLTRRCRDEMEAIRTNGSNDGGSWNGNEHQQLWWLNVTVTLIRLVQKMSEKWRDVETTVEAGQSSSSLFSMEDVGTLVRTWNALDVILSDNDRTGSSANAEKPKSVMSASDNEGDLEKLYTLNTDVQSLRTDGAIRLFEIVVKNVVPVDTQTISAALEDMTTQHFSADAVHIHAMLDWTMKFIDTHSQTLFTAGSYLVASGPDKDGTGELLLHQWLRWLLSIQTNGFHAEHYHNDVMFARIVAFLLNIAAHHQRSLMDIAVQQRNGRITDFGRGTYDVGLTAKLASLNVALMTKGIQSSELNKKTVLQSLLERISAETNKIEKKDSAEALQLALRIVRETFIDC